MRIGQLTTHAGLPAKTIRYLEQLGLVARPGRRPAIATSSLRPLYGWASFAPPSRLACRLGDPQDPRCPRPRRAAKRCDPAAPAARRRAGTPDRRPPTDAAGTRAAGAHGPHPPTRSACGRPPTVT